MDMSAETPSEIASPPDSSVNSPCSVDDLGEPSLRSLRASSNQQSSEIASKHTTADTSTTPKLLDNHRAHTTVRSAQSAATRISPTTANTDKHTPTRSSSHQLMNPSLSMLTLSNDSHPLMFADESANRNNDYDDNEADFADVAQNNTRQTTLRQPQIVLDSSGHSSGGHRAHQTTMSPQSSDECYSTGTRPKQANQPTVQSSPSSMKIHCRHTYVASTPPSSPQPSSADYETSVNTDQQSVSLHSSRPTTSSSTTQDQLPAMSTLRRITVDAALLSDNDDDCSSIDSTSAQHSFDEDLDDDDEAEADDSSALRSRSTVSISSSVLNEAAGAMAATGSAKQPPPHRQAATETSALVPPATGGCGGKVSPIPQYLAADEARDTRHWRRVTLANGEQREIDMRVIEPYQRVLSHGGYLSTGGRNAIVVFSACHLPEKSRRDYQYVMNNLFL